MANKNIVRLIDSFTGENVNYEEVTTWQDGTAMDNGKVDNILYRKSGSRYFKRMFSRFVSVKWFGAVGDGVTDDTEAIRKALNSYGYVFFDKGDYKITSQIDISNKKIRIESDPDAYINWKFEGGHCFNFTGCPQVFLTLNVRNSLPERLKFNDNGIWEGIPQMRVEGLNKALFNFIGCAHTVIDRCEIKDVWAYACLQFAGGAASVINTKITNVFVDATIYTWSEEIPKIYGNIFENISLIPEFFDVIKNGEVLQQSFSTTEYAWQFGQALSIIGDGAQVYNNTFKNVSGLCIGADHQAGAALRESYIDISNNRFIADSNRIRGANPPAFIWVENHQSANISFNRFSYKQRAIGDGDFTHIRLAFARYNSEKPVFSYKSNTYLSDQNAKANVGRLVLLTRSDDAILEITDNTHISPNSNFIYMDYVYTSRPFYELIIARNNIECKTLLEGYNGEEYNGTSGFKLPRHIKLVHNYSLKCSVDLIFLHGEFYGSDFELTVKGNKIEAPRLSFPNGTYKATIENNDAASMELIFDWAYTQSGISNIIVAKNRINKMTFISGNDCNYIIKDNIAHGECIFKNILYDSVIDNNIFKTQVKLTGDFKYSLVTRNLFYNRLVIERLIESEISDNIFKGNGFGIYGYGATVTPSLENALISDNTFRSDIAFNAIEIDVDRVQYAGRTFVSRNKIYNRKGLSDLNITNATSNANLIIE